MIRVIVCGGRNYRGTEDAADWLASTLSHLGADEVVHGDSRGADRWAGSVVRTMGIPVRAMPADWSRHGRAAGPIRNREMLALGVSAVVVFPGGTGTADMRRAAEQAGVDVYPYVGPA